MKKQLDTSSILNELEEGSAFFRRDDPSPTPATESQPSTTTVKDPATPNEKMVMNTKTARNRTVERFDRTDTPNGHTINTTPASAVLTSIDDPHDDTRRLTERYSFEIYSDQKETINDVKYMYYKKTGRKVSSSEIIRDALELFLARVMEKLED